MSEQNDEQANADEQADEQAPETGLPHEVATPEEQGATSPDESPDTATDSE